MLMKMRSKMQNEKGFTLVELMVVVVILGILVAIAVPVYNNVTKKAELSSIEANLRTIDGAIMAYGANNDGEVADKDKLLDEDDTYIQAWPTKPGDYSIEAGIAKVLISDKEEGGLAAGTYTLEMILNKTGPETP